MSLATTLEAVSVLLAIVYVLLAAKEDSRCWPFGIASSAIGVVLMMQAKLYAESGLYVFYVLLGFYGWYVWFARDEQPELPITVMGVGGHGLAVLITAVGTAALGGGLSMATDAAMPFLDAFTTSASLVATWMTARKLLWNWTWWVVIDAVSVGLYVTRGLNLYAGLMVLYVVIAAAAQLRWWARWNQEAERVDA